MVRSGSTFFFWILPFCRLSTWIIIFSSVGSESGSFFFSNIGSGSAFRLGSEFSALIQKLRDFYKHPHDGEIEWSCLKIRILKLSVVYICLIGRVLLWEGRRGHAEGRSRQLQDGVQRPWSWRSLYSGAEHKGFFHYFSYNHTITKMQKWAEHLW